MGDPYSGMEIKKGILIIRHYGGGSWRWNYSDKYLHKNGKFYLIGMNTTFGKFCEEWLDVYFNLATHKIIVSKEYEICEYTESEPNQSEAKIYKREKEIVYQKAPKITLQNSNLYKREKIITPKYKFEIYI